MSTTISSAAALSTLKVRVVFADPVNTTVLDPAAWTFTGTGDPPFATPIVSAVTGVDSATEPTEVELFLEFDLSPGKPYLLTAVDLAIVPSPGNTADFTVPALPVVPNRKFSFLSWIPKDDLRRDDTMDLRYFVAVLDDMLALLVHDVDIWPYIQDPDLAPETYVDQMLVDLGNPIDEALLSLTKKRLLVKSLVSLYKMRGTAPGIIHTLYFFLGLSASLVPLNRQGMRLGQSLLGLDWVLGCGPDRWRLVLRIATPEGRALTNYETRVLRQILTLHQNVHETIVVQPVLAAPTAVSASPSVTPVGVTVSWGAVSGASSYAVIERSSTGATIFNGERHTTEATSLIIEIPADQTRYFVVVAVNAQGDGLESAEVSAVSG